MSVTVVLLLMLIFPVVWYINFRMKRRRLYELATKLEGPPTVPILGNLLTIFVPPDKAVKSVLEAMKYYKSPTRLWIGPKLAVHIWDPKHLEVILTSQQYLERDRHMYKIMADLLGNGIGTLPVEPWRHHRRLIAPAFSKTNLQKCFGVFNKQSKRLVEDLKCEDGNGIFDIEKYIMKRATKTLFHGLLDFRSKKKHNSTQQIVEWLDEIQTTIVKRFTNVWFFLDFTFKRTQTGKRYYKTLAKFDNFIRSIIEDWKEDVFKKHMDVGKSEGINDSEKPVKFVENLLSTTSEEKGKLTDEELYNEVKNIIVGAMDTTASTIGYILMLLGMYPDIQRKLFNEIVENLGPMGDILYENLKNLDYLDRIVKESLRVFPPTIGVARWIDKEVVLGEHTIPADSTILLGMLSAHRDPNTWPNPTKFDPDRFLPEEVAKRHPYSWFPFSAGPRNCVGMQYALFVVKIFVIDLVRRYEIGTCYKSVDEVDLSWMIVLKPTNGFKVSLTSRV